MSAEYLQGHQPDILEVIASLSNDAVFTPPRVVNEVLDLLPKEVWADPALRWLDPGAKTGVFPREITKRLMIGLSEAIPDEGERLEHILMSMVFAVATEYMTGLMTRRSLYCAKDATSANSAVRFPDASGNVWQKRVEHTFNDKGTCVECRGSRDELEINGRDNKAYAFIHANGREQLDREIDMKFDVIIGNPPYQMSGGGGGTNDTPLYNVFVEEAIKLNPRYLSMIIPSRWMAGGRGLEGFRTQLLSDNRVRHLIDFAQMENLFPGVDFEGGVCYFLWDRDNPGECSSTFVLGDETVGPTSRNLGEFDVFVRDERALEILRKALKTTEPSFSDLVSGDTPFGLATNFAGYRKGDRQVGDLKLFMNQGGKRVEHWVADEAITKNRNLIGQWKVMVPEAYGERGAVPAFVLGPTMIGGPKTVCSQTYLCVGPFASKDEASSCSSYMSTRFFRFLVSLRKISQHAMKSVYSWVPQQTWDRTWTDAALYEKYDITPEEQGYIQSMVKEIGS
jgi:site-specific DNA-methyltransferase (adenine-specific)